MYNSEKTNLKSNQLTQTYKEKKILQKKQKTFQKDKHETENFRKEEKKMETMAN